ncbi:MAG: hypothetical protein EOO18_07630 [Chryseobacterium sp.]|nr:MAG: hypothetical protein EOO18_07630 [Chryseobacterium sp.]
MNKFLNDYLEANNKGKFDKAGMTKEFIGMLEFVDRNFPVGFRKAGNHTQVPRIRFEAISVGVGLALREKPNLKPKNIDWLDSPEFKILTTSDASNSKPKIKKRLEYVRDNLLVAK